MNFYKYPRTPHLPWSAGASADDVIHYGTEQFVGKSVIVTEKMDGENTSLYRERSHARSIDSRHHPSRDWVKQFHQQFAHELPEGFRVCGENVFAKHAIFYEQLDSYFYGFSMWNHENICLSWLDTLEWFTLLGITPVRTIYQGIWNEQLIKNIVVDTIHMEGYVVRLADAFHYEDFGQSVAKYVRKNHVQTDKHWMFQEVVPNQLSSKPKQKGE